MALSVSRLVRVTINLSPLAAARRSFGVLMVAGDSEVINPAERFRTYVDIEGVAADFGVEAPEYDAALLYFGQSPKPSTLMIGRWVRVASPGELIGGILSSTEKAISNWTVISAGTLSVTIDGSAQNLTGLDFTAVTNLNGVAEVITTELTGGAECVYDGDKFHIFSGSSGAGVKATGTIEFTGNPTAADTLTLNSTVITFVASGPTGNQVLIGASKEATAANLQAFLNATAVSGLLTADYSTSLAVTTVTYKTIGTGGNAYSLAKSSTAITLSGATLTGGAPASSVGYGTGSISAQMKVTSGLALSQVAGVSAESPVECAAILANGSSAWYGLSFAASVQPTDDQSIDVSAFIEALSTKRIFGATITDTSVLSALVTNDLASRLKALGYRQSFVQYSENAYAVASMFGRAFSVNFNANRSTITLMYKQEPGVVAEDLTESEALILKDKRCNVFVSYNNDTAIIQYGVMSGSAWFDEIHGLDWFQDAVQTECYNLLYQTPTKIPQTDSGVNQIVNTISGVCDEAVNNGLVAPGQWNADGFGQLERGQYLKAGYYIYAQPISLQSQSQREARIAPPIQVALKLAGAIQELDVIVNVNR